MTLICSQRSDLWFSDILRTLIKRQRLRLHPSRSNSLYLNLTLLLTIAGNDYLWLPFDIFNTNSHRLPELFDNFVEKRQVPIPRTPSTDYTNPSLRVPTQLMSQPGSLRTTTYESSIAVFNVARTDLMAAGSAIDTHDSSTVAIKPRETDCQSC